MSKKNKYWDINPILAKKADYNFIFGERSNGKTYGCLKYALEQYFKTGEEFAYLRRWEEDFKGKKGQDIFAGIVGNGLVTKLSKGKWNAIKYYSGRFYLMNYIPDDRENTIIDEKPFGYCFSLSSEEHYKSLSFPKITTIIFDEFITRGAYLANEFMAFTSVLSTIIRDRENVKVFCLGNTINKYNPYFSECGLYRAPTMEQGTIDTYEFANSLLIAVEFCASMDSREKKKSNKYFAFDNPRLTMTRTGAWELDIYPHCPVKYKPRDVLYNFFVCFNNKILHCEVVQFANDTFIFVHRKTTPIKENDTESLIYTEKADMRRNYRTRLDKPTTNKERAINTLFARGKVFYATNEDGELMRNAMIALSGAKR